MYRMLQVFVVSEMLKTVSGNLRYNWHLLFSLIICKISEQNCSMTFQINSFVDYYLLPIIRYIYVDPKTVCSKQWHLSDRLICGNYQITCTAVLSSSIRGISIRPQQQGGCIQEKKIIRCVHFQHIYLLTSGLFYCLAKYLIVPKLTVANNRQCYRGEAIGIANVVGN